MKYYEQEGFITGMQEEVNTRKSLNLIDINKMNLIINYLSKYRKGT